MKSAPTIQKVGPLVFFLAVTAFSLVFVLTGCDNGPLSLEQADQQDETSFFDLPYNPEAIAKNGNITVDIIVLYENYITVEDGGVVLLGSTESAELRDTVDGADASVLVDAFVVQSFSIPSDTSIVLQVTKIITADGEMPIIFDCGPDGLEFTSPAILVINAWENFGKSTTHVSLYWLNEETNEWELEAEVPVDKLTGGVGFQISHFSKWGAGNTNLPGDDKGDGGGTVVPGGGGVFD